MQNKILISWKNHKNCKIISEPLILSLYFFLQILKNLCHINGLNFTFILRFDVWRVYKRELSTRNIYFGLQFPSDLCWGEKSTVTWANNLPTRVGSQFAVEFFAIYACGRVFDFQRSFQIILRNI